MTEKNGLITIDGPSGAGKSTISRLLAARLQYTYLDTGAMYRAVGLKTKRRGLDLDTDEGKKELAEILDTLDLQLLPAPSAAEESRVILDGEDVSRAIRTADMGMVASRVSAEPVVRKKLTILQQEMGAAGRVVAEGRDTGTVVFPRAEYKFFLVASAEERARRRQLQLHEKGQEEDFQELLEQIIKRDRDDSSRSLAPLKAAEDAITIDSSTMTIEEVVNTMLQMINN